MKLIKQFNDWARLNEELENQEILTPDQMKAIAAAANRPVVGIGLGGSGEYSGKQGTRASFKTTGKIVSKDLSAALFANAQDKINIDSDQFKEAVELIKSLIFKDKSSRPKTNQVQTQMPLSANTYSFQESSQSAINEATKTVNVGVAGGASAVGGKSADGKSAGYDNAGLANRRRNNFIAALKTALGDEAQYVTFTSNDPIVGTATVKDSADAKKEQMVKITYPEYEYTTTPTPGTTDIDATSVATKITNLNIDPSKFPKQDLDPNPGPEKSKMMIVKIFYKGDKAEFKKKILQGTGSPARELLDYSQAKDLKFEG
jgi:hypothetical protein